MGGTCLRRVQQHSSREGRRCSRRRIRRRKAEEDVWLRKRGVERWRLGGQGGLEVLCLRQGGHLGKVGEDTQHGPVLSQETLIAAPQCQNREGLYTQEDGETERQSRGAGQCTGGDRDINTHSHAQRQTYTLRSSSTTFTQIDTVKGNKKNLGKRKAKHSKELS